MPDPQPQRDPVELLADEFIERLRRGEHPSISEYTARRPELADEIGELFPTIAEMERLKLRKQQSAAGRAGPGGRRLERLGDFRILREIGRGGMGIVYEAEQESLARHVAVKVLPTAAVLNPQQLQRFEREARTAGRLHHTNIVPVFGVGEDQGLHYLVMQLIQGAGLDQVLRHLQETRRGNGVAAPPHPSNQETCEYPRATDFTAVSGHPPQETTTACELTLAEGPQYWRNVARIGIQAAAALHYAHQRGTLHRDIKPANLLLDAQGVVWITDFGLAKAMEHDGVSQTGELAGTLRYMAPERFRGRADARSDVYSLGLTLYELLTLQPAFEHSDPSALVRRITHDEPPRPRSRDPRVPRDMETIVLKAISREPEHRYRSAQDLADDLQAFLDDRPIRARRTSGAERLWRWCRRNRAVASLSATALLLLVLVAVVATVGYVRTRSANRQVEEALTGESRQREKAEATSALALDALDNIFRRFAPDRGTSAPELTVISDEGEQIEVPVQPVLSKEAAAMLEEMLAFYDRLAGLGGDDAQVRRRVAEANRRIGEIRYRLGQYPQALAAYLRAIEEYTLLQEKTSDDVRFDVPIARVRNELGNTYAALGRHQEARTSRLNALTLLQAAPPDLARTSAYRFELARTCYELGKGPSRQAEPGMPPGPAFRPGEDRPPPGFGYPPRMRPPRSRDPRPPVLAGGESPFHPPQPPHDRREDAESMAKAIDLLQTLTDEFPNPEYRHQLAICYRDMPPHHGGPFGRPSGDGRDKAAAILEELADEFPDIPEYRHDLCKTYAAVPRGRLLRPEDAESAERQLRKAMEISNRLVAEHPNVADYQTSQVHVSHKLASVLDDTGRRREAQEVLRKALAVQKSLVERFPEVSSYKTWLAVLQESLARMLHDPRQLAEARSLLESSVSLLRQQLDQEPQAGPLHGLLMNHQAHLTDVLARIERIGEAPPVSFGAPSSTGAGN